MQDYTPSLLCLPLKYFVFFSVLFLAKQYLFGQESASVDWNSSAEMDAFMLIVPVQTFPHVPGLCTPLKNDSNFLYNRMVLFGLWKTTQASYHIMFCKNIWHREYGVDFSYHESSLNKFSNSLNKLLVNIYSC